jgi:glyoxylase-like metal-dependent hydrolase (beta-lactamase superfamily II)
MIFRQLFHSESSTYTYLLGDEVTRESLLIDPVLEKTQETLELIYQLGLTLVLAIDTHTHADHITGLGMLREQTGCKTMMGRQSLADCLSATFIHGDEINIGDINLKVIYSPGHTDDSYSFYAPKHDMLFSGDTLLIRGTGRTDFQNGDAHAQYHSLYERLLTLPEDTTLYPGHDYKGWTSSTLKEEKQHNPRLQLADKRSYVDFMLNLQLPSPELMDIAVPANQSCGKHLGSIKKWR